MSAATVDPAPTVAPDVKTPRPSTRHAVVGAHYALHRTGPAQRRANHRDRRVGGFHGRLIRTVLHTVGPLCGWCQSRESASQLRAIHHAADHTAGRRVRRHLVGLPGGNRFAAGRQSTVQVHADRPVDAGACPRVSQRVPMLRWFDGIADLRLRDRIPVSSRSPLYRRLLRIGDRDRGLAVIRCGPDRHRYPEPRRDARRC